MPVDSTKSTTWGEKSCLMYFILFKINNIILIFELGLEFVSGKNDNFKFKIPENDRPCCFINILDYVTYSDVQVTQKGSVFKLFSFLFWFLWQARGTPKCLTWPWFRHCTGTRWHCSFPIDSMLVPHKITVPPWDTDVWENIWTKIYERSRRDVLGKFLKRVFGAWHTCTWGGGSTLHSRKVMYHLCCGKVEILTSYPGIFFKYIFDLLNIFTKFKYLVAISNFKFFYDNLNTTNP